MPLNHILKHPIYIVFLPIFFRGNSAVYAVFFGNQLYITRFKFNEG